MEGNSFFQRSRVVKALTLYETQNMYLSFSPHKFLKIYLKKSNLITFKLYDSLKG